MSSARVALAPLATDLNCTGIGMCFDDPGNGYGATNVMDLTRVCPRPTTACRIRPAVMVRILDNGAPGMPVWLPGAASSSPHASVTTTRPSKRFQEGHAPWQSDMDSIGCGGVDSIMMLLQT